MKTTKKQLANFAIGLIKEINKTNKYIAIEYKNSHINIWFYYHLEGNLTADNITLYSFDNLQTNKEKFKKAILKIRGIKL